MNTFKDESIFEGIIQFYDEGGNEYRAKQDTYSINLFTNREISIRKNGDDCFVYWGVVSAKLKSCKEIYNEILRLECDYR